MAKPSYLEAETVANTLRGIALVLENKAAAISKGKPLNDEDAGAFESFAATLRSAAKVLLEQQKDINEGLAAIQKLRKQLGLK
jgi:hypothetical protein